MIEELTFAQLVEKADRIVIARVTGMDSHWNDDQTLIVTDVTGEISEVLKGDVAESRLALQIPGGQVGDIRLVVLDTPSFAAGQVMEAQKGQNP